MTIIPRLPWFAFLIRRLVGPLPEGVVFTYGQRIYSRGALTADLIAHEQEHTRQQGHAPWLWWLRFVLDRDFRYRQELAAYRVQLRYLQDRKRPWAYPLTHMAACLSGAMYGRLVSYAEAEWAIRQ